MNDYVHVFILSEVCSPASVASKKHRLLQSLEAEQQATTTKTESVDVTTKVIKSEAAAADGESSSAETDLKPKQESVEGPSATEAAIKRESSEQELESKDLSGAVKTEGETDASPDDASADAAALEEAANIKRLASELLKSWKELKVRLPRSLFT